MNKVSVVMNTYNEDENYLRMAINSYLSQKDVDVELILSTVKGDKSVLIAQGISNKIIVVENDVAGIYSQLNNGLKYITGDWYVYASSNDVALPTKLKDEVELCIKNNKRVCYSAFYITDKNLKIIKIYKSMNYSYKKHNSRNNFVNDLALISSDLIRKYGPFREKYKNHAYHDLLLRIAEEEGENIFVYNSKPEWMYRTLNTSLHIKRSKNPKIKQANKFYQIKMLNDHKGKMV